MVMADALNCQKEPARITDVKSADCIEKAGDKYETVCKLEEEKDVSKA